ncbi:cysteine synthase [Blyttiomyces helicus]|uniref:Cysteine synthase n=1 Tax=Blyttiomyces helicus TaxID=388810 RepID=A0A4P9W2E6_9FUNG|nr:cysteine synthase [Blyttiomyces helicus]|eukprot:RKO86419.1 cysteine synthase [Blyttiomyces helicus]
MPDALSKEKFDLLRILGADVRPVPVVPVTDPAHYNQQAKEFAEKTENAVWTNQFENLANRRAHFETTGPEIWRQTDGKLDAFTCATGTGGTLAGITQYLKDASAGRVKMILADPPGSALYSLKTTGVLERTGAGSITEGIGQGRVTGNLDEDFDLIDDAVHVSDAETIEMVYRLLDEEGIFVGASSALDFVAAVKVARMLGPGHTVAIILCDGAYRYQSRLFSRTWLETKGILSADPDHLHKYITLP